MSAVASKANQGTILVVDDERDILTAVEDLFEGNYRVVTCDTPAGALDLLRRGLDPSVIISDQRMPGMTGDAFLEEARRLTEAESILLTGYADMSAVVRAVNRGRIVGYVPKPWDPSALTTMVASALERRHLAVELATERALLYGLMENSGDAIAFKDREGRFIRLNEVKAERLGTTRRDALDRAESEFLSPEAAAEIESADRAVIDSGVASESVEETPGDTGSRWFSTRRIPIRGGDGKVDCLVTIEREVTQQRELEERLRQADKMQALGTLAGGVAHDFNNLLTAILGSVDLASRRCGDQPEVKRLLSIARQAGERAAGLTQRLLSFGRKREFNPRVVDLNEVVAGMDELLARTLVEVGIEKALADQVWPARIDPDQLELAILNLAVNARDAMPGGGSLTISTRNVSSHAELPADLPPGDYVVLSVSDTGTGIPAEIAARVFEPFFTTKEQGKGTGLGLSMVYALAQQAGGSVNIDSRLGQGTDVSLYLPRSLGAAEEPGAADVPELDARPVRVLLVDDDPQVRGVTAAILSDAGHEILEAESGPAALDLIGGSQRLDIMVADVAMPGMNGVELADRARGLRPDLPVLLITGYADDAKVENFPVLNKPFQSEELTQKVAEIAG